MKRTTVIFVMAGAAAAGVLVVIAAAQDGASTPAEADERAAIAESSRKSDERQAALIDQLAGDGTAKSLPRVTADIDFGVPPQSLGETIAAADLIVVGVVETQRFEVRGDSIVHNHVTLAVERTLAGDAEDGSQSVTFVQFGGPEAGYFEDGRWHPWLAQSEADPLLFPGDRVLLFLERSPIDGVLRVLPWVGQVHLVDQRTAVIPETPLHELLNGLPEARAFDLIAATMANRQ